MRDDEWPGSTVIGLKKGCRIREERLARRLRTGTATTAHVHAFTARLRKRNTKMIAK
jgi:hypothetical protein